MTSRKGSVTGKGSSSSTCSSAASPQRVRPELGPDPSLVAASKAKTTPSLEKIVPISGDVHDLNRLGESTN